MDGRQIELNDGTIYPNGVAGYAEGRLWCRCPGVSFREAAEKFQDENATSVILFQYGNMVDRHEDFTVVTVTRQEEDGVSVCLKKGAAANV